MAKKNYGVSNKAKLLNMVVLRDAVREVFLNRGTAYMEEHPLFSKDFAESEQRQTMWRAFLRKMKYPVALGFGEVMDVISTELKPMWEGMSKQIPPIYVR